MARKRQVEIASLGDDHEDVIAWYRRRLAEPAVFPWAGSEFEPVRIGPTWQVDKSGHWVLPEATIGWDQLGFTGCWLQHRRGVPWRYTLEQARFILWWGAVDERGRWVYRDGILQRLKGWGKDPVLATMCATGLIGPAEVAYMDGDTPVAADVEDAWIPVVATALAQTRTTMRLFPGLFTPEAMAEFGVVPGKEMVYAYGDARMIQAVTSSPTVLEGIRSVPLTVKNETQHWTESNGGFEMAAVCERNSTKSEGGRARTLAATNAPDPSLDSVGMADRDAYELSLAGASLTTGILYDSLEAAPEAPLAVPRTDGEDDDGYRERMTVHIGGLVSTVRGDSTWSDIESITKSILDTRNPPSRSRRFWLNQVWATEDAWVVPQDFDARSIGRLADQGVEIAPLQPGDQVALFGDGSKSDDATGLVVVRISDGVVFTIAMWQRPPKDRGGASWLAPRDAVNEKVVEVFDTYEVPVFWFDPSHTLDDETQERYWDAVVDDWHRRYKDRLKVWAHPGAQGHSVMFDMTSPARHAAFTAAAERCQSEISSDRVLDLIHDGDPRLVNHVRNARRAANRYGTSVRKEHRESQRKIDLAVCMIGARMARRAFLNSQKPETERSGVVYV